MVAKPIFDKYYDSWLHLRPIFQENFSYFNLI